MILFLSMRVLDRYILRELAKVFLLSVFVLLSVLLLEKLRFLSDLLLTKHASLAAIGKLLLYLTPAFMVLAAPLGVLLSTLMVFSRLSAENEITAMRASGISLYRLLAPVAVLSIGALGLTLYLSVNVEHAANLKFRELVVKTLKSSMDTNIKERRFNSGFEGLLIYVNENDRGTLRGVFISDQRNPESPRIIESRLGRVRSDPEKGTATIELADGIIHRSGKEGLYRTIAFESYALRMDISGGLGASFEKETPHMSIPELRERIEKLRAQGEKASAERVAIHKKFAAPAGCLALGLLGAPLGIMTHRRGAGGGFGLGVVMIVLNYILWMTGQSLGAEGKAPAELAIWAPNVIMASIGLYLVLRVSRDTMPTRLGMWASEMRKRAAALRRGMEDVES